MLSTETFLFIMKSAQTLEVPYAGGIEKWSLRWKRMCPERDMVWCGWRTKSKVYETKSLTSVARTSALLRRHRARDVGVRVQARNARPATCETCSA